MGPPFDHTMADPRGHYLFVDVNEHEVSKMNDDGKTDISEDVCTFVHNCRPTSKRAYSVKT